VGDKRGPLFAGIAVVVLIILVVLFLVLPKMGEVSDAQDQLDQARSEQVTLEAQRSAVQDAKDQAPEARATIADVDRQVPPTADESGLILLLQNAADTAGVDISSFSPGTPTFDPTTGLSTIPVTISATGTYFDVTEFMYRIETLPRAAKVTQISLGPADTAATGTIPVLTLSGTIEAYTSDASAGPGSIPGPTDPSQVGGA
jgi:type IV pilus assembly protein PilO